jgi:hypothetical protein
MRLPWSPPLSRYLSDGLSLAPSPFREEVSVPTPTSLGKRGHQGYRDVDLNILIVDILNVIGVLTPVPITTFTRTRLPIFSLDSV